MYQLILMIHIIVAIILVALVLVQQGRGASVGAAFGSGASQTVFGSRGSGSFLLRLTIGFGLVFFITALVLNNIATKQIKQEKQISLPVPMQAPSDNVSPNSIPTSTKGAN